LKHFETTGIALAPKFSEEWSDLTGVWFSVWAAAPVCQ